MKYSRALGVLATAGACAMARDARAGNTCSWVSTTGCSFGQYSGPQDDTTGQFVFNCTVVDSTQTLWIEIHAGGNGSTETTRYLSNPSLKYQFYRDSARTQYWGSTPNSVTIVAVLGNNTVPIYCRIPGGQTPVNGAYSDSSNAHLKYGGANSILATPASATVNGLCSTSVTTNLSFGAYDPVVTNQSTALDGTATLSVNCTSAVPYKVTLGQGSNAAGGSTDTAPLRQMASGANRLSYSLYQNSGRTTVWGNTAATGVAGSGTGSAQAITVYGRVPAGQNKATGSYADTILATLTF